MTVKTRSAIGAGAVETRRCGLMVRVVVVAAVSPLPLPAFATAAGNSAPMIPIVVADTPRLRGSAAAPARDAAAAAVGVGLRDYRGRDLTLDAARTWICTAPMPSTLKPATAACPAALVVTVGIARRRRPRVSADCERHRHSGDG
jgi:hypothetical protein